YGFQLCRSFWERLSSGVRDTAARLHDRRSNALHPQRRSRNGVDDRRSGARVLGQASRRITSHVSLGQLGPGGGEQTPRRRSYTLALAPFLLPLVALLLSSTACQNQDPS